MHLDSNGLILEGTDGGDTCQRQFEVYMRQEICAKLGASIPAIPGLASPAAAQHLLEISNGEYVRNPEPPGTMQADPSNVSRDQLTSPICYHSYMAYHGNADSKDAIARLFSACKSRYMFAQNKTDIIDPSLWGVFLRSSKKLSLIFYPLLMLCDLFTMLSIAISIWGPITKDGTLQFRARGPNEVDDDNINNVIMVNQYTMPTPISWLARKLYKRFRKINYGNIALGETSHILGAMAWYHRPPLGNPEIVDLARPIVEKY